MPDPQTVLNDPVFQALPLEERRKVMLTVDPQRFSALPSEEQDKALAIQPQPTSTAEGPSMGQQILHGLPGDIGGAVGGIIGGLAGAPVGLGPAGVVGGSFAGGTVATGVQELLAGKPAGEAATEAVKSGAFQGAAPILFKGVGRLLRYVTPSAISGPISEGAKAAVDFFMRFAEKPKGLFSRMVGAQAKTFVKPGELTASRGLQVIENASQNALIGGGALEDIAGHGAEVAGRALDELIADTGPQLSAKEAGTLVKAAMADNEFAVKKATAPIYNSISQAMKTGQAIVRTKGLIQYAQPLAAVARDLQGIAGAPVGDALAKAVERLDTAGLPYGEAQDLLARFSFLRRQAKISGLNTPAVRDINILGKTLKAAVKDEITRVAPDLLPAWNTANQLTFQMGETFQNKFILGISKFGTRVSGKGAEDFVGAAFSPGKVTNAERLMKALTWPGSTPGVADGVRRAFASKVLGTVTNDAGEVQGASLLRALTAPEQYGEASRVVLGPHYDRYVEFAKNLANIQQKRLTTAGSQAFRLAQPAAVIGLATGHLTGPHSLAVLIAPDIAARLLAHPVTFGLLTRSLKTPLATKYGASLAGRLTAEVAKITMQDALDQHYLDAATAAMPAPEFTPQPAQTPTPAPGAPAPAPSAP